MITAKEYEAAKKLQETFITYHDLIMEQPELELKLDDGQRILIKGKGSDVYMYDYIFSAFGVVRILRMNPIGFDITPLCLDMDHKMIDYWDNKLPRIIVSEGCVE